MRIKQLVSTLVKILIACVAFYFVFQKIDVNQLFAHLRHAHFAILIIALLAGNLSIACCGLRSQYYLRQYGLTLNRLFCITLLYVSSMFNVVLPGGIGGDAYRVYVLWKRFQFPRTTGVRVMIYERMNGLCALMATGLIATLLSNYPARVAHLRECAALLLIGLIPMYAVATRWILRDRITFAFGALRFSLMIQICQVIIVITTTYAFIDSPSLEIVIDMCALMAISSLLANAPISIGGAGIRELTFLYGLKLLGNGYEEAGVAIAMTLFVLSVIASLPGLWGIYHDKA